ncbi:MAG: hypothetical protein HRU70_15380 [Phycisphaeraceae bacterium]|nr:MAG: hypothetical protein HRU70_15380 [Phycisphaeraceae bacterium]
MAVIPANLARVPNALVSRLSLANIARGQVDLLRVQEQIATGRSVLRVSDDPVKAATIAALDHRLEQSAQRSRNLSHARAALSELDRAFDDASGIALDAKDIAASMAGLGPSASDRASQSVIVQQMLNGLLGIANRTGVAGHVFGGSTPGRPPVEEFRGGFRFRATGPGLVTDLGEGGGVPITMGQSPLGATSARVRGTVDLEPDLTPDTRLADLNGARALGVTPGTIEVSLSGGVRVSVDLSAADSIGDVARAIEAAVRAYESDQGVTILGPGGVSIAGAALTFDVLPGENLQFFDLGTGVTAKDLGLTAATPFSITQASPNGSPLDPKLTWRTPVSALAGVIGALGSIRVNNLGATAVVDLSGAQTLQDLKNLIEGTNLGVRVVINDDGTGIDVLNEVAGTRSMAMSIEEIPGQNSTASRLGIRSFYAGTRIADLNEGRGVRVLSGVTNPTTGLEDPALNRDFEIVLGDAAGTRISIDLRPAHLTTAQGVLDAINAQILPQLTAAGLAPGDLTVMLGDGGNGLRLVQNPAFPGPIRVEQMNNSHAARDLGLLEGTYVTATGTFEGKDPAKVRVDNLFSHLLDLRESLSANDTTGITFAGEGIEGMTALLAERRGLVGGYARRVDFADELELDRVNLDEQIRSELRDADFTTAAVRMNQVQLQLTAALQVTAQSQARTLLDYL